LAGKEIDIRYGLMGNSAFYSLKEALPSGVTILVVGL